MADCNVRLVLWDVRLCDLLHYFNCFGGKTPILGGHDGSVGIATRCGLDGPRIEYRWGRDIPHSSRPALGPTQPTVQWVPGLCRG